MNAAFGKKKSATPAAKLPKGDGARTPSAVTHAWAGPLTSAPPEVETLLRRIRYRLREI